MVGADSKTQASQQPLLQKTTDNNMSRQIAFKSAGIWVFGFGQFLLGEQNIQGNLEVNMDLITLQ